MKSLGAISILLLCFALAGCKDNKEASTNSGSLEVTEFAEMISDPSEKIVLDVRTPEEFNEGHIQYARLINFFDEDFKEQINQLNKKTPVYVYCASGVRSDKAATILRQEGFREVYVLKKGFREWQDTRQEIFK